MIKRYLLFLLLLFFVSSSVNAEAVTIPENCTISPYFVVINEDTLSADLIALSIEGIDWKGSAPVITGQDDHTIYFASKNDLGRFCTPPAQTGGLLFSGDFKVYADNKQVPYSLVYIKDTMAGGSTDATFEFSTLSATTYYTTNFMSSTSWSSVTAYYGGTNLGQAYAIRPPNYATVCGSGVATTSPVSVLFDQQGWAVNGYDGQYCTVEGYIVLFGYFGTLNNGTMNTVTQMINPPPTGTLELYTSPDAAVYEGSYLLGTTDNGGYLPVELFEGKHQIKIVKDGFWDSLNAVTIVGGNETELFVTLAPKNAIFQVSKELLGNIYPNSVSTLSMDINPIKNAYAAKLRISGADVNKVYYNAQEIPKAADGSYILGDVTSTQNIEIQFKTPSSWGEKAFAVEISATDIEGTAYTNLETINYEVLELPFLLEMPETFGIGLNDITLTDMSGTAYSILLVLYDSDGTEKWSSSTNLLEYCEYTFEVPIGDAGDYTLELNAKAGTVKTYYSIEIIEPVTLVTEEITVNPGKIGTVQFKISNPTSNVKYYTASLTCPFLDGAVNKTFSIAPGTVDKTVDISFEVPEGLELENYQLVLKIYDPDRTDPIYSGNVVLTISNESLIFASVPGGNTTIILLAAAIILIVGTFAALRLKK